MWRAVGESRRDNSSPFDNDLQVEPVYLVLMILSFAHSLSISFLTLPQFAFFTPRVYAISERHTRKGNDTKSDYIMMTGKSEKKKELFSFLLFRRIPSSKKTLLLSMRMKVDINFFFLICCLLILLSRLRNKMSMWDSFPSNGMKERKKENSIISVVSHHHY